MKKIIVTNRGSDYHACLEGNTKIWGAGNTVAAAIFDLLAAHSEAFQIEIQIN